MQSASSATVRIWSDPGWTQHCLPFGEALNFTSDFLIAWLSRIAHWLSNNFSHLYSLHHKDHHLNNSPINSQSVPFNFLGFKSQEWYSMSIEGAAKAVTTSRNDISDKLHNYLKSNFGLQLDWRSKTIIFGELGLSSEEVLEMIFSLSEWLSEEITLFEYSGIELRSDHLYNRWFCTLIVTQLIKAIV